MEKYITEILVLLILLVSSLLALGVSFVWARYVKPWLVNHNLMAAAEVVVSAVETIIGRYHGEEKWILALEKMEVDYGFNIDNEMVLDALRAAWKKLDLSQLVAGEKVIEECEENA